MKRRVYSLYHQSGRRVVYQSPTLTGMHRRHHRHAVSGDQKHRKCLSVAVARAVKEAVNTESVESTTEPHLLLALLTFQSFYRLHLLHRFFNLAFVTYASIL